MMDTLVNKKTFSKLNRIELRVYEMLGIKVFKRTILWFEKLKHRKDGIRNENYHPQNTSITSLKSFSGYLVYNTLLHIVSLLLVVVYCVITMSTQLNNLWIDIFMYVVAVFNLYCIILQRYIYLKIKAYINKAIAKWDNRIQEALNKLTSFLKNKDEGEFQEEYELLQRFYNSQCTGNDCVLNFKCIEPLNRLVVVAEHVEVNNSRRVKTRDRKESLSQILTGLENRTYLMGKLELQVSRLQKSLKRVEARNVSFGYCIIAEDGKCEEALCRLFPDRTRERVEYTTAVLLSAYQQKGLVKQ